MNEMQSPSAVSFTCSGLYKHLRRVRLRAADPGVAYAIDGVGHSMGSARATAGPSKSCVRLVGFNAVELSQALAPGVAVFCWFQSEHGACRWFRSGHGACRWFRSEHGACRWFQFKVTNALCRVLAGLCSQ